MKYHFVGKDATIVYCVRTVCLTAIALAIINPFHKGEGLKVEINKPLPAKQKPVLTADGEEVKEESK